MSCTVSNVTLRRGYLASSIHTIRAHVRRTPWRLPPLIRTAVPAVQILGLIVAQAVVHADPFLRAAGGARSGGTGLLDGRREVAVGVVCVSTLAVRGAVSVRVATYNTPARLPDRRPTQRAHRSSTQRQP